MLLVIDCTCRGAHAFFGEDNSETEVIRIRIENGGLFFLSKDDELDSKSAVQRALNHVCDDLHDGVGVQVALLAHENCIGTDWYDWHNGEVEEGFREYLDRQIATRPDVAGAVRLANVKHIDHFVPDEMVAGIFFEISSG